MKLITSLIFALAIVGTQARFNLRNYAQQKLKAQVSGDHIVQTNINTVIRNIVDRCFEAELGVNNGIITNTVSASKFDTPAAIDSINLCLQSSNLRLGHKVDAGLQDSMDEVKKAAESLVLSQKEFNTMIEEKTPGLESAMGDIQGAVQSAVKKLNTGYEKQPAEDPQQSAESLETFLASKESSLEDVRQELDSEFDDFDSKTSDDIADLTKQIEHVARNESNFAVKRGDLSSKQGEIVTAIVAHYKEVDDGSFTRHPVSGNQGEGCGVLDSYDNPTKETPVLDMCGNGLTCAKRNGNNVVNDMSTSEVANLEYSGFFVCSTRTDANATTTDESILTKNANDQVCKDENGHSLPADGTSSGTGCNLVRLNA